IAAAMRDTGFKCIAVTSGLDGVRDTEAQLRETEDLLTRYHKPDDNFTLNLGHHAEYTASDALLRGIAALAKKYKAPVHHHLCETRAETDECVARTGLTPPARAEAFGLYEYGGTGYHCVHVSDGDVEIFKRHGVSVVTNPCSNLKLASGIAPLQKYADAGIPFALGTDGAASNNALDMFREAYLASVLQKYSRLRPESTGAHAVLHAAFSVGADIQGIEAHGIAAGQIADFCVLDLESPNLRPFNDITAGIVFSADPGNVRMTVVNGKILYHKGAYFTGETPEKVYAMCEKITARIKSALKKAH
ncbi:MAG: amidohydrolase family protein, partial [Clostridiales bacterium]|nr:amidohydrolase family protein [Clostridiales bacterium]